MKARTEKGRILLLEDHAALANLRRDFLMGQGYEVVCCGIGEDARRLLESQPFHLLIADVLLTSDSRQVAVCGWEVAAFAKQRGVPVILSSGRLVRLGSRELRSRGIDYLCPKPCSLHQLLCLVENALRKSAASGIRRSGTQDSVRKP